MEKPANNSVSRKNFSLLQLKGSAFTSPASFFFHQSKNAFFDPQMAPRGLKNLKHVLDLLQIYVNWV